MERLKFFLLLVATCCFATLLSSPVVATEAYADRTGAECKACHIDPLGGGDLTEFGKGYLASLSPEKLKIGEKRSPFAKNTRLAFLYVHILTAFMWFGTILYVHLVLKPAYASQGLPSGEVKVGLASMAVMAITGAVLTYFKVPSLSQLPASHFGMLLMIKVILFSVMLASALYVVPVIGPRLKKKKAMQTSPSDKPTHEELASFDGSEGRPSYFAYKGKIYDVSQSKPWKKGNHMKRHQAGADLTDILSQAPHDEDKILSMPEVGEVTTSGSKPKEETPRKVFYFMAYMNLGLVFIISLILALWRW